MSRPRTLYCVKCANVLGEVEFSLPAVAHVSPGSEWAPEPVRLKFAPCNKCGARTYFELHPCGEIQGTFAPRKGSE